mgnify:CR=1 FL=1
MKFTKASRYTLLFSSVCLVIALFVIYVQQSAIRTYEKSLLLVRLGPHVKSSTSGAVLTYQSIISGNKSQDLEQNVIAPFQSAIELLQGAYNGLPTGLGTFSKPSDEDILALLKEAIIDAEMLPGLAREGLSSGTDSKLLAGAAALHSRLDRLSAVLDSEVQRDSADARSMTWLSAFLLLAGFGILSAILYRTQRHSDRHIQENSAKLQQETKRVETLSQFIEAVSAGNYDIELQSENEDDSLTATLVNMRNTLRKNGDDDRKRNWTTTGLAQIGEILRTTTARTSDLYDNIIRFLVKYTGSNQGGLFILNDDSGQDRYLDLVACYAFERKKYLTRKVGVGEGLVGQCFLEGQTIYLLEVPQDYVSITSGLGGANPNSLLIVPMRVNDQIYGVIELASFKKYEPFEIELVEKLAESIASTISNVQVNETTRMLLERTQQQAEEMKSQEEEIRQNMEELEATQEEMRRKQTILEKELEQSQRQGEILRLQEKKMAESQETLQAIVDNIPRAIFWKDKDLRFQGCNKIFSDIAGAASPAELMGKTDFDMAWSAQADAYRKDDMEVMRSRVPKLDIEEVNINSDGQESWVRTSKVPIVTASGEVVAILGMFEDITALKRREAEVAFKLKEREQALREIEELRRLLAAQKA